MFTQSNASETRETGRSLPAPVSGTTSSRFPQPGRCGPEVPSYTRRTCVRARDDSPLIFSVNGSGVFHRGRMINLSQNGLCFSSFCCLPPGTSLRVKARNMATRCFEPSQKWHEASVVWVRQVNTEDGCFQTGIRFTNGPD